MKLFLDTADIEQIKQWDYLIDGITTNPSHLTKAAKNPTDQIKKIIALLPDKDISVEITKKNPADVYKQAHEIAALAENIVVKIPCYRDYYPIINKLVQEKININITLVFTLVQSLLMCKMGVRYISPFVGRWDDIDVEGADVLYEIREMVDRYGFETQILAASLRHVRHVHQAIEAGADVATVPPKVLEQMSEHILTDKGMAIFDADWKKLSINTFP